MQFQIPQFIETEDKIVGPLTLPQFGYLALGGGLSFAFFFLIKTIWIWFFFLLIFGGGGAAFAFVKINGRSLTTVTKAMLHYLWRPTQYVWQTQTPKAAPAAKTAAPRENHLEKIVAGFALKNAWRTVQTGSKAPERTVIPAGNGMERYEVFRGLTGEQRAARRVDYR